MWHVQNGIYRMVAAWVTVVWRLMCDMSKKTVLRMNIEVSLQDLMHKPLWNKGWRWVECRRLLRFCWEASPGHKKSEALMYRCYKKAQYINIYTVLVCPSFIIRLKNCEVQRKTLGIHTLSKCAFFVVVQAQHDRFGQAFLYYVILIMLTEKI